MALLIGFGAVQYHHYNAIKKTLVDDLRDSGRTLHAVLLAAHQLHYQQGITPAADPSAINPGFLSERQLERFSQVLQQTTLTDLQFGVATLQARDPSHLANSAQSTAIRYFQKHPDAQDFFRPVAAIAGDPAYLYARPIRIKPACMTCHGSPEQAPTAIANQYTTAFGYEVGDLRGIMSLQLPESPLTERARRLWLHAMREHALLFLMMLMIGGWLLQRLVIRKIHHLQAGTRALTAGDYATRVSLKGRDEIADLADSFNDMAANIESRSQALRESEERLAHYLRIAGVIFVALDRDCRVTLINTKGTEVLGYAEADILGRDWLAFLPKAEQSRFNEVFQQIVNGNLEPVQYNENPVLTAAGDLRLIAWHNSQICDAKGHITGLLASGADITEQRRTEQRLREERAFLQHVIDGIDDPILVLDSEFTILRMNRAADRKATAAAMRDTPSRCHQLLYDSATPCEEVDRHCPHRDVMATGESSKVVHEVTTADGQQLHYEVATSPLLNDQQQVVGVIELQRDITAHLALAAELKASELDRLRLTQYDLLTSLPNRLLFADRLSEAILTSFREGLQLAVLIVDLDRFKQINESFAHQQGDNLLKAVAERLQERLNTTEILARLGSDEFGVISAPLADAAAFDVLLGRVQEVFHEPFEVAQHQVILRASIGISQYPVHGKTTDDLLRKADAALHQAKSQGGNQTQYYCEALTADSFDRVVLKANLYEAIQQEQFLLHFQPQFELASTAICGFEALVRWQHPQMGMVSPGQFIPLAEETGMINELGHWVLRRACQQMQTWRQAGRVSPEAVIAVNLSAQQFDQPDLVAQIKRILAETGLPAPVLELEITESTLMRAPEQSANALKQLRTLGIKLAIDDFGTGYSSLSYLKRLPLTRLKIDRSFISDIPNDENDVAITRAVIAMASSLGLEVLAEGIETAVQNQFLCAEGCRIGQGYWFAKPLDIQACEGLLSQ